MSSLQEFIFAFDDLPPMPRNQSHQPIRSGKGLFIGKTSMARLFESELKRRLQEFPKDIFEYDRKINGLLMVTIIYSPDLLTKDGKINEKSVDWDAHKIYHDCIAHHIGIDDSQNLDVRIVRRQSDKDEWKFITKIQLWNKEDLFKLEY